MSLKNHIEAGRKSPIGLFFLQRFPKTTSITTEVNKQLRTASTLLPTDQSLPNWVYGMLGRAIDYRICYSFEMRPHTTLTAWELYHCSLLDHYKAKMTSLSLKVSSQICCSLNIWDRIQFRSTPWRGTRSIHVEAAGGILPQP